MHGAWKSLTPLRSPTRSSLPESRPLPSRDQQPLHFRLRDFHQLLQPLFQLLQLGHSPRIQLRQQLPAHPTRLFRAEPVQMFLQLGASAPCHVPWITALARGRSMHLTSVAEADSSIACAAPPAPAACASTPANPAAALAESTPWAMCRSAANGSALAHPAYRSCWSAHHQLGLARMHQPPAATQLARYLRQ